MGAKDWMLLYADGEVRPVLQAAPALDRPAAEALVAGLYRTHRITRIRDGTLLEHANPPDDHVYAGCFPGLAVVCTAEAGLDRPSELDRRFLAEATGRTVYLHAMHSVVDWFAFAIWDGVGTLQRALSLAPDYGIMENIGVPLGFEEPFWSGAHAVDTADPGRPYPLPFDPLELGEAALRGLFGFNYEGICRDDDPDLERIVLAGFTIHPLS